MARTVEEIEAELLADPTNAEIKFMVDDEVFLRSTEDRLAIIHQWAEDIHIDELADDAYAEQQEAQVVIEEANATRRRTLRAQRTRLQNNVTQLRANSTKLKDKPAFDAMTAAAKADALRLAQITATDSAADVTDAFLKLLEVLKDRGIFVPQDDVV